MTHIGRIVGDVEFRTGDGPKLPIPQGRVEVETTQTEAILSWTDEDTRGATTMPIAEFKRYVAQGAIELQEGAPTDQPPRG